MKMKCWRVAQSMIYVRTPRENVYDSVRHRVQKMQATFQLMSRCNWATIKDFHRQHSVSFEANSNINKARAEKMKKEKHLKMLRYSYAQNKPETDWPAVGRPKLQCQPLTRSERERVENWEYKESNSKLPSSQKSDMVRCKCQSQKKVMLLTTIKLNAL